MATTINPGAARVNITNTALFDVSDAIASIRYRPAAAMPQKTIVTSINDRIP